MIQIFNQLLKLSLNFYFEIHQNYRSQIILTVQEIGMHVYAARLTSKRLGVAHLPVIMLQPLSLQDQLLSMGFLSVQITVLSFVTDEMSCSVVIVMEMQQQVQQLQQQQLLLHPHRLLLPLLHPHHLTILLLVFHLQQKSTLRMENQ